MLEQRVVAKYNVTSTSDPTWILDGYGGALLELVGKMWIDGVEQSTIVDKYTFDTLGEHEIKFEFNGTSTGNYIFAGVPITTIFIPGNVEEIGDMAMLCPAMTSVVISEGVASIGYLAFSSTLLTTLTLPSSITNIKEHAFSNLDTLTNVTINAINPPKMYKSFYNTNCSFYVPVSSVEAYKSASGWSDYADRIYPIKN